MRKEILKKTHPFDMDGQIRDEAVRDRIRAVEEFLDPSMFITSSFENCD